ncbi:hypothetical protein D3C81_1709900 [compost metagenome]
MDVRWVDQFKEDIRRIYIFSDIDIDFTYIAIDRAIDGCAFTDISWGNSTRLNKNKF